MSSLKTIHGRISIPVPSAHAPIAEWIAFIHAKVEILGTGSIQIVVHDGRITSVESTERVIPASQAGTATARRT